jgi:hypothetical protein
MISFKIKGTYDHEPKPFQLVRRVSDMAETNYEHMCYLDYSEAQELSGERISFLTSPNFDEIKNRRELFADNERLKKLQEKTESRTKK